MLPIVLYRRLVEVSRELSRVWRRDGWWLMCVAKVKVIGFRLR